MDGPGFTLYPIHLVIVQSSPFCNIDCNYCYLGNRLNKSRMSLDTVRSLGRFLSTAQIAAEPLTLVWHAGEPLAVPIEFYEAAFTALQETCPRPALVHNFQTNGTLIDEEWCRFFKKWSARIGVSLDGPKEIHDAHRVDRTGRGTFDRAMRGVQHLRDNEIAFTTLCVVTRDMLGQPDLMWDFWESLGVVHVGINIEEVEAYNIRSSLFESANRDKVKRFFARLADRAKTSKRLQIRELVDMRRHLTAPLDAEMHRAMNRPGSLINIDLEGNISTFSPELLGVKDTRYGTFTWGNVHRDTWTSLAENPDLHKVYGEISAGIEKCRDTCGYFAVCGGGDPSNKLAENGSFDSTQTHNCEFRVKALADVVVNCLEEELGLCQKEVEIGR